MIQSTLELLASWFTPTSLFVLVNIVIGTIAITSHLNTPKRPQEQHHQHQEQQQFFENPMPQLTRAPSLIDRVKSINLSFYKFDSPFPYEDTQHTQTAHPDPETEPLLTRAPSLLERVSSFKLSSFYRSNSGTPHEARLEHDEAGHVQELKRCMQESDAKKVVQEKMKKSASEKISGCVGQLEEEEVQVVEKRRPETMRLQKTVSIDEEINEKADDFINKFKQQLRLQRLDSLLKYKEMLGRGSANDGVTLEGRLPMAVKTADVRTFQAKTNA